MNPFSNVLLNNTAMDIPVRGGMKTTFGRYFDSVLSGVPLTSCKRAVLEDIRSASSHEKISELEEGMEYVIREFSDVLESINTNSPFLGINCTPVDVQEAVAFLRTSATKEIIKKNDEFLKVTPVTESLELDSNTNSKVETLLEYYAGKSKELLHCEDCLREIIKDIKQDRANPNAVAMNRNVYRDNKWCKELEKTLAKFFKINQVKIYWGGGELNAYTWTSSGITSYFSNQAYLSGKETERVIEIAVFEDLVTLANLNEREILALILHEIGHNFYFSPISSVFDLIFAVITLPVGIIYHIGSKMIYSSVWTLSDYVKKYAPTIYTIAEAAVGGFSLYYRLIPAPLKLVTLIQNLPGRLVNIVTSGPSAVMKYGEELGADSLAVKYGYGPDLATAFKKMSKPENDLSTNLAKGFGTIGSISDDVYDICDAICRMLTLEPHPNDNQRVRKGLDTLKKDLKNKDYPPSMRKSLEKDIEKMERAYEVVNDVTYGDKNVQIKKTWYQIIDNATNGHSDIREVLNFYFDKTLF